MRRPVVGSRPAAAADRRGRNGMIIPRVLISLLLPVLASLDPHTASGPVPPKRTMALVGPMSGKEMVFADEFDAPLSKRRWTVRSSAYTLGNMNPADDKLDIVSGGAVTVSGGRLRLTATRSDASFPVSGVRGYTTGLITT